MYVAYEITFQPKMSSKMGENDLKSAQT
jgi:hypothetical protein